MSRLDFVWCGAIALAGVTGLAAQTPPGVPRPPQGDNAATGVVATVTATGCLEHWSSEAAASPTDEPPEEAPAGVKYVLTHVEGHTASATSAGAGKTEKTQPETRYLLLSSPSQDFAPHLSHKVKIVGTIAPQASEGASPADRVAEPSSRETNLPRGPKSEAYRYNLIEVSSLTMVSRSCGR